MLRNLAEESEFQIEKAETRDLNGKTILWVEGRWKDAPYRNATIFVNADGSGRVVQEVSCFAAEQEYQEYAPVFEHILGSLEWL